MLLSKAKLYPETDQITSFYARALTHPARLQIMRSLRTQGPQSVQQLAEFHPITLPAISQHLELLRETSIIDFQPHYPYLIYNLENEDYRKAFQYLIDYLQEQL